MPESIPVQTKMFRFTAAEGNWRELLRQLNEFAKMVQTDLQTQRVTTDGVVLRPVDTTNWRKDEIPLGLVFLDKTQWDGVGGYYLRIVAPNAVYRKQIEYLTQWASVQFDE